MEPVTPEDGGPLDVSQVVAHYGNTQVLNEVSFSVNRAEAFGLVGLNGAGKTTLIRSILSLRPSKGTIRIFGKSSDRPDARHQLVYLPEKFQPSSHLTGWEYLSISLAYFGQRLDRSRAQTLAAGVDLDPSALGRRIRTYSKGMGQKLGLASTLLIDTPLMILDEPMSGLDPRARVLLKDRLKECRSWGRSIFFSSHILSDIEELCDRIAVIHEGRIIFVGTPQAFMSNHPAPTLERSFLAALTAAEPNAAH